MKIFAVRRELLLQETPYYTTNPRITHDVCVLFSVFIMQMLTNLVQIFFVISRAYKERGHETPIIIFDIIDGG